MNDAAPVAVTHVDLKAEYEASGVAAILDELEHELIGLQPVKQRIREVAALLIVERARKTMGLSFDPPTLHMSFTGNPGTAKPRSRCVWRIFFIGWVMCAKAILCR